MKKLFRSAVLIMLIILGALMVNKMIARQIIIREANDPADKVLMVITARGGLCADGPCQYPIREIHTDGSYTSHAPLSLEQVKQLKTLIAETNFKKQLPADKRSCPSYADGQDAIWSFPEKYDRDQQFVVCETDITESTKRQIIDLIK